MRDLLSGLYTVPDRQISDMRYSDTMSALSLSSAMWRWQPKSVQTVQQH